MKHYLSQQYRNALFKYKKFKTRFEKSVEQGISTKKRRSLAQRLKKLYNQIVRLETQLKWAVSAGALSLVMASVPSQNTFAQQTEKIAFVELPTTKTDFVQAAPAYPIYPTFADLDNDGDKDLIIGEYAGGVLYYQRNPDENDASKEVFDLIPKDDPRNPFRSVNSVLDGYGYLSPSFADVDNDGDLDLIVGYKYYYAGLVTLFKNVDGDFVPFTGYANPFFTVETYGYLGTGGARGEMLDNDGDGDLDLFVSGNKEDKYEIVVRYYEQENDLNDTPNTGVFAQKTGADNPLDFVSISGSGYYGYTGYGALTFADVDADGDLDAFIGEKYGQVFEYKNNGDNTFASGSAHPTLSFNYSYPSTPQPAFSDLDSDGDLDALIGEKYSTLNFPYKENDGSGNFTLTADVNSVTDFDISNSITITMPYMSGSAAADLDNDGDKDLVTVGFDYYGYGVIKYFKNNGNATFEEVTTGSPFAGIGTTYIPTIDLADFDKDGDFDLVIKDYNQAQPRYYQNTGTPAAPSFTQLTGTSNPLNSISVNYFASIQLVDFDADGDLDALMGDGTQIRYFQNTGTGFTELTGTSNPFDFLNTQFASTSPTFKGFKPKLVDLDEDGDLDLFFGVFNNLDDPMTTASPDFANNKIYYYQNREGVFEAVSNTITPFNIGPGQFPDITLADFDGDEDLDLVVGEYAPTARVRYFEQVGNNFCPKVDEILLKINVNATYDFVKEEFQAVYSDEPDTKLKNFTKIRILAAPSFGTLIVGGSVINTGGEISYAALDNLVYIPNQDYTGIDSFAWQAFDPVGQCYSNASYVRFGIGTEVTGLDELNKLVGIHPNPSNGVFNINLDKSLIGRVDIQVYNALGAVVRSYHYDNPNEVEAIDLQAMPKGLYIVRISNQGKDGTIKIVKE